MTEVLGILILCYLLIGMEALVPGGIQEREGGRSTNVAKQLKKSSSRDS